MTQWSIVVIGVLRGDPVRVVDCRLLDLPAATFVEVERDDAMDEASRAELVEDLVQGLWRLPTLIPLPTAIAWTAEFERQWSSKRLLA